MTFQGRVKVALAYDECYHSTHKDWQLKEARLAEKEGMLWLKCVLEKEAPKAFMADVLGIVLNFKNVTPQAIMA